MTDPILAESYELNQAGEPFALVTVVHSQRPTSGKPGDRAIVRPDGSVSGWIGGGCSQSVVVKEGLRCLREGEPRFVRIRREEREGDDEDNVVAYAMTCPSGGAMDLHIQPFLPQPRLLILGTSPVAQELEHLASRLDFDVSAFNPTDRTEDGLSELRVTPRSFVVVATMGSHDEWALTHAAMSDAGYVAFVSSREKMSVLTDQLRERGITRKQVNRVNAPAGLDIKAATPAEIALSILAEIVQIRRSRSTRDVDYAQAADTLQTLEAQEARDPVCGMMVDIAAARHLARYAGHVYYFCCSHCRAAFEEEPAKHVGEEIQ